MSKLVAIDAGHGINTAGRRCLASLDLEQHREWWLNSRVAVYVQKELQKYDCETIRTDDVTGLKDVSLVERCEKANKAGAKAFVSIHHNAGINGGSGGGVVVYAARSATAAKKAWQKDLYDRAVGYNGLKGNRSNPLPLRDYTVIVGTNMPALLIECGFMDSKADVPRILSEEFARQTAKGIAESIADYLDLERKETEGEEKVDSGSGVVAGSGVAAAQGRIKIVYEGDDGVEVHNTPDLLPGSRNRKYGPVYEGEVFTVVGRTSSPDGTPMYQLKSGLYITALEEFVHFY